MLALPLQGYAGTHMLMCAQDIGPHAHAVPAHAAPRALPCHGDIDMAMHDMASHDGGHGVDKHGITKHDGAKSGSCAACSLLAPMAMGFVPPPDLDGPVSIAIPFHARRLPSVAPALPDRPPRPAAV